ncbi:CPBP family intramembrane glutamic endopeptidase [Kocuria sp.]|uniref:CPBP family intramembrane glutamic endopeptidase n=1 Tax=Kocuria sp. TaxID=1871328 RepID=UPI0026DD0DF8|nr:type II CAAX endopeptidase family protein [Kocuria sp.]MDO4918057.1 type II CAAX endopeptidase family protein [Kocuria sp.]
MDAPAQRTPDRVLPPRPSRSALEGMSEARRPTGPVLAIVVAVLIPLLGQLPALPLVSLFPDDSFGGQLILTASFVLPMLLFFAWVRFKEKRPVASLGFRGPAGRSIALGALLAVALTTVTVLLNVLLGTASLAAPTWAALPLALVLLLGFAIQSSTEEITDRGYLMQAVAPRWGLVLAVVVQTVAFAALHGANGGLTWVAWGNLCMVAVFLALWVWVTGSLWGACAFHTFWNWSQGNLWGAPVSHMRMSTSVGHYTPGEHSPTLLTGGAFGLEGSVIPLVVFIVLSALLVVVGRRRRAAAGRVRSR